MVKIYFEFNGGEMYVIQVHQSITLDEVKMEAMSISRCGAPRVELMWRLDTDDYTVSDECVWRRILEICVENVFLTVIPMWDEGTSYGVQGDYEVDESELEELNDVTSHMSSLRLRWGSPDDGDGECSNTEAYSEAGNTDLVEVQITEVEAEEVDTEEEPIEEVSEAREEANESDEEYYQYPPEFTSGDWEKGFESNDWDRHASSSSHDVELAKGDSYADKDAVKVAVKEWHINNARQCCTPESNKKTVVFECVDKSCSWHLRASVGQFGSWYITVLGPPHSCVNAEPIKRHRQIDCSLIANHIYPYVWENAGASISFLQQVMFDKYGERPTYRKVWYAKFNVIERIYGTHESAFNRLPKLLTAIAHYNPGTVFDFDWRTQAGQVATFSKCFWAYAPSIIGFPHCRPLISIDGTHLYGKYRGKLLVAVAYDANNQIFPLAFTLCDNESTETWTWFLRRLRDHVTMDARPVCIISDRHKGIIRAVDDIFPQPHGFHRYCARHVASNFNSHFKNKKLKEVFEEMLWTSNKHKCLTELAKWQESDGGKYKNFIDRMGDISTWALSHDGGLRFGNMTTNHSEVFNKVLKGARSLPVTALVEVTFMRMNTYWIDRTVEASRELTEGHTFPEKTRTKLRKAIEESRFLTAIRFGHAAVYRVATRDGQPYVVNLDEKECECGEWRLFGRPCKHAICAIKRVHATVSSYVDSQFNLQNIINAYEHAFQPLRQEHNWPVWDGPTVIVHPQMLISPRGRKKVRIPNEMDTSQPSRRPSKANRCGKCGQEGHNRRSCKSTS